MIAATLGQFALLRLIVFGVFSGAAIACASVGAVGSLVAGLALRRGPDTQRRRLALCGAAAGVAVGCLGAPLGLGVVAAVSSIGVSAWIPVTLLSSVVAGVIAGVVTTRLKPADGSA